MTTDKHWTYADLTAAAEREIRFFALMDVPALDKNGRHDLASRAFGVYFYWDSLTGPYQAEGDKQRLRAMVEAIPA